jgi:predicted protein tyrosine phosphatase
MKNYKVNAGKSGKVENPNSKKVLCVCWGGCSRSVGLSNTLKYGHGHDTLVAGIQGNNPETLDMLCKWADIIVVMSEHMLDDIAPEYQNKLRLCEVNKDTYFNPNKELYDKCAAWVNSQEDLLLDVSL